MRLVANHAPEVLLVLATGSGKSLAFMLGSSLPDARTTVVVVPLVLLRLDLLRRCREMGLNPIVWRSSQDVAAGMEGTPTLLFVSVEVAIKYPFRQYARRLYDTGNLERIMIDECHLIHTSAHYRKQIVQLNELRQFPVPFVYITATLPLRLEKVLFQKHHIGHASIVRGCSKRSNLTYQVQSLQPPKGDNFLDIACSWIVRRWKRGVQAEWKAPRVMVFVRSCADAEAVAESIGCLCYHRDIGSIEEKEVRLNTWMSGESGSPFLACTTAAGPGVDYPHVRWVIHLEDPYGLIDYAQESGRAGRDGDGAAATILLKRDPILAILPTPLDHPDPVDDEAIKRYLQGVECRRLIMARELDEAQYWQACGPADALCDVCEEGQGVGRPSAPADSEADVALRVIDVEGAPAIEGGDEDDGNEAGVRGGLIRRRRKQMEEQYEMDQYMRLLLQVQGQCMLCRLLRVGCDWHHPFSQCPREHRRQFLQCKAAVKRRSTKGQWMKEYAACYRCGQPQSLCQGWEGRGREKKGCEYQDLVVPTVWALWEGGGLDRAWLVERLEVEVKDGEEVLIAAGRGGQFGGVQCIIGVRVLAELLERWSSR